MSFTILGGVNFTPFPISGFFSLGCGLPSSFIALTFMGFEGLAGGGGGGGGGGAGIESLDNSGRAFTSTATGFTGLGGFGGLGGCCANAPEISIMAAHVKIVFFIA